MRTDIYRDVTTPSPLCDSEPLILSNLFRNKSAQGCNPLSWFVSTETCPCWISLLHAVWSFHLPEGRSWRTEMKAVRMVQGREQFLQGNTDQSNAWKKVNEEGYRQWMVLKRWRGNDDCPQGNYRVSTEIIRCQIKGREQVFLYVVHNYTVTGCCAGQKHRQTQKVITETRGGLVHW